MAMRSPVTGHCEERSDVAIPSGGADGSGAIIDGFPFYPRDCHASVRTGSQ